MCSFRLIPRQLHNTVSNVKNIQQQITFTSVKRKLELDNHSYPTPSVTREEDISYSFSDQILSTFPERINQFSENLCHDYNRENWATKKNASKSKNLIFHIRKALEDKNRTIIPIGSCVNGLAHRNSDLDLVLMPYKNENQCHKFSDQFRHLKFRRDYMKSVLNMLKSCDIYQPSSEISIHSANVPIIHFLSTEGIKVDIQFCNAGTIKSSLFVKTCVELNPSVAVVIYWLNRYFKDIMLKDSRNGLFSAYHLNMLALHFFQASTCRMLPRILEICPQLDPNSSWIMPANILKTGKKVFVPGSDFDKDSCSVGEMIVRLIDYYSQLDLQQISIDISGGILERSVDSHNGIISLIDPYFISQSQPRCKVKNGCSLIGSTFSILRSKLKRGEFKSLELKTK